MPRRGRRPSNTQSFDEELDETRAEPLVQIIGTSNQDDVDGDDVDSSVVVTNQSPSTASELDLWEASRSAVQAANASEAWVSQAGESEITDDPVRMYLREIGRVDLLTAEDERVLARSLELEVRLIEIESEIRGTLVSLRRRASPCLDYSSGCIPYMRQQLQWRGFWDSQTTCGSPLSCTTRICEY